MVLRYHWGEGIGHAYAHSRDYNGRNYVIQDGPVAVAAMESNTVMDFEKVDDAGRGDGNDEEYTLEDREDLGWDDRDSVTRTGALVEATQEIMDLDDIGSDPEWADND